MKNKHLLPYEWNLKDGYPTKNIAKNNYNVFGTFICGGGSTMGYKLAGFNHLGGVEIDKKIANVYNVNHKPKHLFIEDLRLFNKRENLPNELYNLDLLDGSPPCSTFSMVGSREKAWGKSKKFKEGQACQVLDDLVYIYIDTIAKLKPKVCLLENVKGIISGNAKVYSKKIVKKLNEIGYNVQVFLLNAATMGVPQKRERVFFIGVKTEYEVPKLVLNFNERGIVFKEVADNKDKTQHINNSGIQKYDMWYKCKPGDNYSKHHQKGHLFGNYLCDYNKVSNTIVADNGNGGWHPEYCRMLNANELIKIGTYPADFNFLDIKPKYLIGMSVPPVMTAQIANQIKIQWLDKI